MNDFQHITSERQEPTFFAMVPQMALDDLDPYELALYCRYRQIASESGSCFMSNKELAKKTHMSVTRLKQARTSLEARKYIRVVRHVDDATGVENAPPTVTLRDIWAENHQLYSVSSETGETTTKTQGAGATRQGVVAKKQGGSRVATGGSRDVTPNNISLIKSPEEDTTTKTKSPNGDLPRAKSERKPPPHEPLYQALLEAQGLAPDTMTASAKKPYYVAAAELHSIAFPLEAVRELVVYVRNKAETEEWRSWGAMALSKYAPEFLARYKAFVKPAEPPPPPEPVADDYDDGLIAVDDALLAEFDALVASKTGGAR